VLAARTSSQSTTMAARPVSRSVLGAVPLGRRLRVLTVVVGLVAGTTMVVPSANAANTAWVVESEIQGGVVDSETAEDLPGNDCDDLIGIPAGDAPGWVRVTGDPNPHAPIIEVSGQILDPQQYVAFPDDDDQSLPKRVKTNAFVTHTDATFNHFGRDINVFITLDPEDRKRLAHGNFVEGDINEHGHMEIEWERGGIPMFAFPAMGDRMTVWGPHIFDCGHGDTWVELEGDNDTYRTEIHPPVGWVMFRNSADADGKPQNNKQNQSPWQWFESSDLRGGADSLPSSGLLGTTVEASVADAYWTTYGGNVIEALNGCDNFSDASLTCYDYDERPELSGNEDIDSWEWHSPILDDDYTFVVPAPQKPAGAFDDVVMVADVEERCEAIPPNPTIPNRDTHPEAVDDEVEGLEPHSIYADDRPIGAATCNPKPAGASPLVLVEDHLGTASWNDTGRPAVQVTLRAQTGADGIDGNADDPTYPANDYLSFAYRVKVGWDHAPAAPTRPRVYRVELDDMRVYDDGEPCVDPGDEDGEWIMSLRVGDQYIHPVEGTFEDDNDSDDLPEPMWETEAVDDDQCIVNHDATFNTYNLGPDGADAEIRYVSARPGESVEIWERAYDKDDESADDLSPTIREFVAPIPGGTKEFVVGNGDIDVEMSHTIVGRFVDVTPAIPATGTLEFGQPQHGPTDYTNNLLRVSGETPVTVATAAGIDGVEYRIWPEGQTPGPWQFDLDGSDGFAIDLPDEDTCAPCRIEWATIDGVGADAVVSERTRVSVEIDNVPPVLTVPDDFSVYANQTAGAKVEYLVSATDDLPGPIVTECNPGSGTIFPNGADAPLATTVTCTATDTVETVSTDSFDVTVISPVGYVNDYALLGIDWLDSRRDLEVQSGNVGVFDASAGIPARPGTELNIDLDGSLPMDALVAAHTVNIGDRVNAGEVLHVDGLTVGTGAVLTPRGPCDPNAAATLNRCAYVPLWSSLPPFHNATPGAVGLSMRGTSTLPPGNYGALQLRPNSVVTLLGGDYSFSSIELQSNSVLRYSASSLVRVAGQFVMQNAIVEPSGAATPSDLVLHIAGTDPPPNRSALELRPESVVAANFYVPNGTAAIDNGTSLVGAVIGRRVHVGSDVRVVHDSAFKLQP
jgi:hypothetical protein